MIWELICITIVVVVGFAFYELIKKNHFLKQQITAIRVRNPAEIDLEWATFAQIIGELKRRPVRIMMIFPDFQVDEESQSVSLKNVAIEVVGIPPPVAADIMKVTSDMFDAGEGRFNPPCEED